MTAGRAFPIPVDERCEGPCLWIGESLLAVTERLLRSYGGAHDHEGIVYWGGLELPQGAAALTAVSPVAITTWGSFRTERDTNTALVLTLASLGLSLVAQVHSHPGEWVDHSDGDDGGALVKFHGFWSLVVPNFAQLGMRNLEAVGVHLFDTGAFRRLGPSAVSSRVRALPIAVDLRAEDR